MRLFFEEYGAFLVSALMMGGVIFGLIQILAWLMEGEYFRMLYNV